MDDRRDPTTRGLEADDAAETRSGADAEEVEIWRRELEHANEALALARAELEAVEDRALRARAEVENQRRRHQLELERARQQGLDGALLTVLTVHDDLERALVAAAESDDPASIVPGVESVLAGLLRQLRALGLERTGEVGEPFDAERHEAVMAVPAPVPELAGTIQEVFEAGFVQGDRLVRPARVVVYQGA